jgi:hypothetical protein
MATTILSFSAVISVFVANTYYGENLKLQQKLAVAMRTCVQRVANIRYQHHITRKAHELT